MRGQGGLLLAILCSASVFSLFVYRIPSLNVESIVSIDHPTRLLSIPVVHDAIISNHVEEQLLPVDKSSNHLHRHNLPNYHPQSLVNRWSKSMLEVQKKVLREIRAQQRAREESARKVAEASYRDNLSSLLYLENRRTDSMISRERSVRSEDKLQAMEDAQNSEFEGRQIKMKTKEKLSEIVSQRLADQQNADERLERYARVGSEGLNQLSEWQQSGDGYISSYSPAPGSWLNTNT